MAGDLFNMLQQKAQAHNLEHGTPSAAQPLVSNMVCPNCNTDDALLVVNPGRGGIVCRKNSSHRWGDLTEVRALNPRSIMVAPKTQQRATPGSVNLTILVHETLKQQLDQRFGTRLDVTLSALCGTLLDPDAYVVPGPDAEKISETVGSRIFGSAAIKGKIIDLVRDRDEWKAKAETAKPGDKTVATVAPGQVLLTLGPMMNEMQKKATDKNQSLEEFLANVLWFAYQNQWMDSL